MTPHPRADLRAKSPAELEALIAEAQAALDAKGEPDWEAWLPAEEAYRAAYNAAHQDDRRARIHGLIAALPLAPADPVDDVEKSLRSLRTELELRFTGQFVENALCTIDAAIATLNRGARWPGEAPQDHWTTVGAIKSARALIKAADDLSFAAQLSGGVAGRDDALCAAIAQWAVERDKQKQVLRIIELEGDSPEIGAGSPDRPLRAYQTGGGV